MSSLAISPILLAIAGATFLSLAETPSEHLQRPARVTEKGGRRKDIFPDQNDFINWRSCSHYANKDRP